MFKNILVVTDFSPNSMKALPPALFLAASSGATVHLCHVDEEEQVFSAHSSDELLKFLDVVESRRSAWLEDLANQIREQGPECKIVRLKGYASREIAGFAESEGMDLTVISALGGQGFKALLTGTTSANVLRHASTPLLFVGANCNPADDFEVKRVLFPTVFSPVSADGVLWAAHLCKQFGARLELLHVLKVPSYIPALPGEPPLAMPLSVVDEMNLSFEKMLDGLADRIVFDDIGWEVIVGEDEVEKIAAAATSKKVDLVVMARSGLGMLEGMLFGRLPENVARLSSVPTLLFNPEKGEE